MMIIVFKFNLDCLLFVVQTFMFKQMFLDTIILLVCTIFHIQIMYYHPRDIFLGFRLGN